MGRGGGVGEGWGGGRGWVRDGEGAANYFLTRSRESTFSLSFSADFCLGF